GPDQRSVGGGAARCERLQVGAVGQQQAGHAAAPGLPLVGGAALGDQVPQVLARRGGVRFAQVEAHDVVGAVQQSARGQFLPGGQELPAALRQGVQPGELGQFPQSGQGAGPAEEEVRQAGADGTGGAGAAGQPCQCGLGLAGGFGEAPVGGLFGVGQPQVVGQGGEQRGRVLGPAGHAHVDLGGAAVAVGVEEGGQADVGQGAVAVAFGQLGGRGVQQQVAVLVRVGRQLPQAQVHLGGDVVRHAAQHGVDLAAVGGAGEQQGRDPAGQHAGGQRRHGPPQAPAVEEGALQPLGEAQPLGHCGAVQGRGRDHVLPGFFGQAQGASAGLGGAGQGAGRADGQGGGEGQRDPQQCAQAVGPAPLRGEARVVHQACQCRGRSRSVQAQGFGQQGAASAVADEVGQVQVGAACCVHDLRGAVDGVGADSAEVGHGCRGGAEQ